MATIHTEMTKETFEGSPKTPALLGPIAVTVHELVGDALVSFFYGMEGGQPMLRVTWVTSKEKPRPGVREALLQFVRSQISERNESRS